MRNKNSLLRIKTFFNKVKITLWSLEDTGTLAPLDCEVNHKLRIRLTDINHQLIAEKNKGIWFDSLTYTAIHC